MPIASPWPSSFARVAAAASLGLIALVGGCATGDDLGGTWRAVAGEAIGDKLVFDEVTGEADVGIELLVGHYGPDMTGLVKFYRTSKFQFPRTATNPDNECACTFIHAGKVSADSTQLEFDLRGCIPGAASHSQLLVRAELELDTEGVLEGHFRILDKNPEWTAKTQTFTFERVAAAGVFSSSDLICETPDQDDGNIYNGL